MKLISVLALIALLLGGIVPTLRADDCPAVEPPHYDPIFVEPAQPDPGTCTNVAAGGVRISRMCFVNKPSANANTWNCWCKSVSDSSAWCLPLTDGCTDHNVTKCNFGFSGNM